MRIYSEDRTESLQTSTLETKLEISTAKAKLVFFSSVYRSWSHLESVSSCLWKGPTNSVKDIKVFELFLFFEDN